MVEKKDFSNYSDEMLQGYNEGRRMGGLPRIPLRAWQYRLFFLIMVLMYLYLGFVNYLNAGIANAYTVASSINIASYLFIYESKQKNFLIGLAASAFIWWALGLEGMPLWFNLIPTITFILTIVVLLVKWNGRRSEWSVMWFRSA